MNAELSLGNERFMGTTIQRYLNITIGYVCPIILGIMSVLIIIDKFIGLNHLFGWE
jgi:NSS family neurotransmitter:Na+ symporter